MKLTRQLPPQSRRDAWVEINLDALQRNAQAIARRVGVGPDGKPVGLMAILKADAYGHGAVMCLPTLEASGIAMIGVASMDEALQIRQAGIELPILVIGMVPDWSIQQAVAQDIQLTVFDLPRLESLKRVHALTGRPVRIQIKVDTGMHRIGVDWQQAAEFIAHCQQAPYVRVEGVFSHLASTADRAFTQVQIDRWRQVLAQLTERPPWLHLANSSGAIHYPEALTGTGGGLGNMIRVGVGLFGYDADGALLASRLPLAPVMGLKARIIHLQDVPPDSGVSYGHTYHTPAGRVTRVATLPLGYADGVPRCLSNRIEGLLRGVRVPQIGTITMDQMMFDVSALPQDDPALLGDTITLLGAEAPGGEAITLSDWAAQAGTIEYELMCALRVRLPKTYTR